MLALVTAKINNHTKVLSIKHDYMAMGINSAVLAYATSTFVEAYLVPTAWIQQAMVRRGAAPIIRISGPQYRLTRNNSRKQSAMCSPTSLSACQRPASYNNFELTNPLFQLKWSFGGLPVGLEITFEHNK